jgi:hypothetical protein
MACSDIKEKLKSFLEDLLSEDEYQAFVAHVDGCAECKKYVSAVGSLSNQLWDLGNVKVPTDLSSTILFKLKEAEKEPPTSKVAIPQRRLIAAIVTLFAAALLFFISNYFITLNRNRIREKKMISAGAKLEEEEGSQDINEIEPSARRRQVIEKRIVLAGDEERNSVYKNISATTALHWHFSYSQESQATKLLGTLRDLGINLDYDFGDILIFSASGAKIEKLLSVVPLISTFYNFNSDLKIPENKEMRVIMYLENENIEMSSAPSVEDSNSSSVFVSLEKKNDTTTKTLHWHVVSLASKQSACLSVIREFGGSIDYESEELAIFKVNKDLVEKLVERIQAIDGVFADIGRIDSVKNLPDYTPVRISIYFSKK